jgi:hypothetical protein
MASTATFLKMTAAQNSTSEMDWAVTCACIDAHDTIIAAPSNGGATRLEVGYRVPLEVAAVTPGSDRSTLAANVTAGLHALQQMIDTVCRRFGQASHGRVNCRKGIRQQLCATLSISCTTANTVFRNDAASTVGAKKESVKNPLIGAPILGVYNHQQRTDIDALMTHSLQFKKLQQGMFSASRISQQSLDKCIDLCKVCTLCTSYPIMMCILYIMFTMCIMYMTAVPYVRILILAGPQFHNRLMPNAHTTNAIPHAHILAQYFLVQAVFPCDLKPVDRTSTGIGVGPAANFETEWAKAGCATKPYDDYEYENLPQMVGNLVTKPQKTSAGVAKELIASVVGHLGNPNNKPGVVSKPAALGDNENQKQLYLSLLAAGFGVFHQCPRPKVDVGSAVISVISGARQKCDEHVSAVLYIHRVQAGSATKTMQTTLGQAAAIKRGASPPPPPPEPASNKQYAIVPNVHISLCVLFTVYTCTCAH